MSESSAREQAQIALYNRKQTAPEKVDNSALHAGSPMYYYCRSCGWLSDVLPEDHLSQPKRLCAPCKLMQDQGWL
jgi:hypothetical protein